MSSSTPSPNSDPMPPTDEPSGITVRTFVADDQPDVLRLYNDGLLAGQIAANDTGADIDNIQMGYFVNDRHHFWVAETQGRIVGMIGVADDEDDTAEIRRLRVDKDYQASPIAALLLETAVEFCREHEYLKVRLDTRFARDAAVEVFDDFGFQHTRTRATDQKEKELLEFYLDLYRAPRPDED